MKKLFFSFLALLICLNSHAQIATDIAALRADINTQVTTATGFHSVTHTIHGNILDTICGFLNRISASSSAAGDLQAVTTLGNTTDKEIWMYGGGLHQVDAYPTWTKKATLFPYFLTFRDVAAGGASYLRAISHSSPHYDAYLPAEGSTSDPAKATIVLHETKDAVRVTNGTLYSDLGVGLTTVSDGTFKSNLAGSGLNCIQTSGGALQFSLGTSSGVPYFMMKDAAAEYVRVKPVPSLGATRDQYYPDEGSSSDIPGSTLVTHKTKDDIVVDNSSGALTSTLSNLGWVKSHYRMSGTELEDEYLLRYGIHMQFTNTSGSPFIYTHTLEMFEGANGSATPPGGAASIINSLPERSGILAIGDKYFLSTNANLTLSYSRANVVLIDGITANRTVNMSFGTATNGDIIRFVNLNSTGFTWSLSGGIFQDCGSSSITTLANNTAYVFMFSGGIWYKIN